MTIEIAFEIDATIPAAKGPGRYLLPRMETERREGNRRSIRVAVIARRVMPNSLGDEAHGETVDLSMGGFGAMLDGAWGTGDVVDANLVLGTNIIRLRALVVGVTDGDDHQRVHCAFSMPQEPTRSVLAEFLAEQL